MSILRLDMTMSLDGYVTGPDDGPEAPLGIGGFRLFNWLDLRDDPGPSGDAYAEQLATRALVSAAAPTSWRATGTATTTTARPSSC